MQLCSKNRLSHFKDVCSQRKIYTHCNFHYFIALSRRPQEIQPSYLVQYEVLIEVQPGIRVDYVVLKHCNSNIVNEHYEYFWLGE